MTFVKKAMNKEIILSSQVQSALSYIQSIDVSSIADKLQAGRHFYEKFIPLAGEQENVFRIENRDIDVEYGKIKIRIYRPSASQLLPVLIYFHGGWFCAGSLETHDRPLRSLTNSSGILIISVAYRLAPENPFPAGLYDCYQILNWVVSYAKELGVDTNRISVGGDSAGGALAASVARRALNLNGPKIVCQVLLYPVTDASLSSESWKEFADGPNLTLAGAIEAWYQYTPIPAERLHPDASPLYAENLSGMPNTLIIEAEYDPLRDEAIHYAQKLRDANVHVVETLYKGMIHGFFQMGGIIDQGQQVIKEVANFLRQQLTRGVVS